ncbi:DUF6283 family protein [Solwaraspora sp. WMMD1047]|uniref:DUF6283 family protein n=1 Tax=Solwaraspora sp. WMMD1047 TaxID=3016102 RepID=UPI0024175C93|nr:DUF6283 family protein [Solwaraspora sp. WMMD1047]MDG4834167.1 DUF6283 family protein [Solwaraspora sp. WMMD1047]
MTGARDRHDVGDEGVFEPWGADGESLRCRVCAAVDGIVHGEIPSMAGYGTDTWTRCTRCGSTEDSDPIFGHRATRKAWPPAPPHQGTPDPDSGPGAHADTRRPASAPCGTCPYRRDVPSGLWDAAEYAKLPGYDAPTALQPPGLFLCHQADGRVCGGWAGCHDGESLLALRLAALRGMDPREVAATRDYTTTVPLFGSGQEAAAHGMARVDDPDPIARRMIDRLTAKAAARGLDAVVRALPAPGVAVDGDCLTWAPATATRLRGSGYPAQVVDVASWVDHSRGTIAFIHRTVVVTQPGGDPADGHVVDVTARQFDPALPARWLTGWSEYLTALAQATGVERVTRWPEPPS